MCLVGQNYQQPQLNYGTNVGFDLSEIILKFVIFSILFWEHRHECTEYWIKCCIYLNIRFPSPQCFILGDELEKILLLYVTYCIELCHSNPLQEQRSLSLLSAFMYCILRFSRSCYGNLSCITVGGNSEAQSLYRFIWWPRIVIHEFLCLYFPPWSQKTLLSHDSVNRSFPFTVSIFLQLCVYMYHITEILMEVHIFGTAHPTQFE